MQYFKSKESSSKQFSSFEFPLKFLRNINDDKITLKQAKENQNEYKSNLNSILRGSFKTEAQEH